jgi:hypothetical protein
MPRLIAADLYVGRRLRLDGVRHRIARFEAHGAMLVLVAEDPSRRLATISRSALLARICEGSAILETALPEVLPS